jgi:hypothetical protein
MLPVLVCGWRDSRRHPQSRRCPCQHAQYPNRAGMNTKALTSLYMHLTCYDAGT